MPVVDFFGRPENPTFTLDENSCWAGLPGQMGPIDNCFYQPYGAVRLSFGTHRREVKVPYVSSVRNGRSVRTVRTDGPYGRHGSDTDPTRMLDQKRNLRSHETPYNLSPLPHPPFSHMSEPIKKKRSRTHCKACDQQTR